jgi:subfamily B ATP-binding cassette protein MsbA
MQQGEIIERGNHQQLLANNGTYKKLYDMQSFK